MPSYNAQQTRKSNVRIGGGWLFIDVLSATGDPQGERYVGDTIDLSLTVTEERATIDGGDGSRAQVLIDHVTSRRFAAACTMRDMSAENLALLLQGETVAVPEVTGVVGDKVTDEAIGPVKQGLWYQLGARADAGATPDDFMGALAVKDDATFAVKAGNTVATANAAKATPADFRLDAENGRAYIVPGGGIANGNYLKVTYNPAAAKRERARTKTPPEDIVAAVRYVEDAPNGAGRNVYIRRATLGSSGDFAIKTADRSSAQGFQLTIGVLEPGGADAAITIDGRALKAD